MRKGTRSATSTSITIGGIIVDFIMEAAESDGVATVFECIVAAGDQVPPPHSHDAFDETIYGLEGVFKFVIGGEARFLGPGESLCIRRGQVHEFVNTGPADAKFLSVATPGVFGPEYFREYRDVLYAAAGGPPDAAALAAVMERHGLTPAP
ncbi:MAG TPA: cupin domain-containing protein [Mycobacterium sp.]|nr:cupin domain-containing protein [Mycobacterium sp.]